MTFGSLFCGIGGFDLGLERSGMTCSWQVEIDPFARKVLEKHWPYIRRHDDINTFLRGDVEPFRVDVLCGGFPCQDISNTGNKVGINGERSGLWKEYLRTIRALRPRYVIVENVPAILVRGIDRVLGGLAEIGYDAEWQCLPAYAFGSPQVRDRIFIVAYPYEIGHAPDEVFNGVINETLFKTEWKNSKYIRTDDGKLFVVPDDRPFGLDHGFSQGVCEYGQYGNAVVPQVAEFIGRLIVEHAARKDLR